MIYILAALLPPLGLLFNGQPFSAVLNHHNCSMHYRRLGLSRAFPRAVAARDHCRPHEAREPQAPRARGRDRTSRPATRLASVIANASGLVAVAGLRPFRQPDHVKQVHRRRAETDASTAE